MNTFFKKHLGRIFAAAILAAGFAAVLKTTARAENNPVLAQTDSRRNADYVRVYNEDAVDHAAGTVMIYTLPASVSSSGAAGLSVSTTSTANVVRVAGVVPYGETLKASKWGRLQVFGYHPAVKIGVANSSGDVLVTSTTAEKAGVYTLAASTSTVGADFGVFGVTLEATTSSTTVKTLLKVK